ncbi:MAG: FAD-dependent oxidoreductase [Chloroflexota bacterium]
MKTSARVVVIGGGVGGCSTLYHLAKMGWTDVVLLERDDLTSGTTWHSAAQVTQFGTVQTMVGLKKYSTQLYTELNDDPDFPMGYHKNDGGIRLAHTQDHLDGYHHFVGMAKGMGVDFEVLTPSEMAAAHPLLNVDGLVGGLWDPVDGDIDPSNLTRGLAHQAQKLGAEVYKYTPVTGLTQKKNGEWIVHTPKGDIVAEFIVNATGYRVNEVGRMMGIEHPVMSMEHQYMLTTAIPEIVNFGKRIPLIRDPGDDFYCRQEHEGLLLGIYEQGCKPWGLEGISPDFTSALVAEDMDRLIDNFDRVVARMPPLGDVGINAMVNGPITYSADGLPLIGKIPNVRNAYACLGLRAGIGEGGGLGKILAEIIIYGESEWDSWVLDPRRFTQYATVNYTTLKAIEEYQQEFVFHLPDEWRPAGRPAKTTPLYDALLERGAYYGYIAGWERSMYFNDPANPIEHKPSFRHSTHFALVDAEAKAVRERAGITEISGFTRYEVSGEKAAVFLNHLSTNKLPRVGRTALAYCCDEQGRLVSEFTITRLAKDRFMLLSAAAAEYHDWQWLTENLDVDYVRQVSNGRSDVAVGDGVMIRNLTGSHTAIHLAGPRSRDILAKVTDANLDNKSFPWLAVRQITIGMAQVTAVRVTFTGELGYELHLPTEYARGVYDRLVAAGEEFGMVHFGLLATESLRLEKCYRGWKADLITEFTPLESGLERFVRFDKGDFLGREALLARKEAGYRKRFVPLIVDSEIADAHTGDPIYAGDALIGVVTSAGYGHTIEKSIAMGFVNVEYGEPGTELEISIIGTRRPAVVVTEPIFDPEHKRPRG